MRTCGHDPFDLVGCKTSGVFFDEFFKETCFPHSADFIAAALFLISQDSKIDLCSLERKDKGLRNLLDSRVRGSSAADKVKKFSPVSLRKVLHFEILGETLRPFRPLVLCLSPRVSVFVGIFHGFDDCLGDVSLFDQRPSHPDDQIHGLQPPRATDRASLTGGAVPKF